MATDHQEMTHETAHENMQESMFAEPTGFDPAYEDEVVYEPVDEEPAELAQYTPEAEDFASAVPVAPAALSPAPAAVPDPAPAVQVAASAPEAKSATQPETQVILTAGDFAALEQRVLRAVEVVRHERQARLAAEQRTAQLDVELAHLKADTTALESLQQEIDALRAEREQVRIRVERLLSQLDALEI